MLGTFKFANPTRVFFGDKALSYLVKELKNYGNNVMLCYGGGSIKKNGIYDDVMKVLKDAGKTVFEDPGVMPNPTIEKLHEGCKIVRDNNIDLILAVGGGSTIDYAKGVSVSAYCEGDPWTKYYLQNQKPDNKIVPVGCVLTMVGTGSEMNAGSVITNHKDNLKIGRVFDDNVMPRFAILNPKYTFSVPKYQMVAGIYDAFNHICEQYFSDTDDNVSDYLSEALMKSLITSSKIAVKDPQNYEARSNIMWAATWALNTLIAKGKKTDWEVHMLGHAVGTYTDATHGMTLAAVSLAYYRLILPYGLDKFKRFAKNVWDVDVTKMSDKEAAEEGLKRMEAWMKEIGVVLSLKELGVKEEMFEDIANATFLLKGGYKTLTHDDVIKILKESM